MGFNVSLLSWDLSFVNSTFKNSMNSSRLPASESRNFSKSDSDRAKMLGVVSDSAMVVRSTVLELEAVGPATYPFQS